MDLLKQKTSKFQDKKNNKNNNKKKEKENKDLKIKSIFTMKTNKLSILLPKKSVKKSMPKGTL